MKQDSVESGRSGIQVISRAARILRILKDHPKGMSLGQIATELGLARSTVQRIVSALQAERLLIANMMGAGVRLGPELGALAAAAQFNTAEQCRPVLLELTKATGETSDLSVLRGDKMIFIDQVTGTHRLRTISSVGEAFPLLTTANGRASLARLPRADAISRAQAEAARTNTELDVSDFNGLLDKISATGFAHDLDEHADGISAIGFAFVDHGGEIHAISVPVPTSRFERQKEKIELAIQEASQKVTKALQTENA